MSPSTRIAELRHAARFARTARERLREGQVADALRYYNHALHVLAFTRGALSGEPGAIGATGTLRRVLAELGAAIEAAVRRAPGDADPVDLIEDIAAAVDVLRTRDGVAMDSEAAWERARGIVTVLLSRYRFTRV